MTFAVKNNNKKTCYIFTKDMLQSGNSDKIYECQTCGKTFNRRTYLQLHEKIHGEKCYKCNICDKSFSQPAGLWIHKKRQSCLKRNSPSNKDTIACTTTNGQFDDDGKRHKCDICNRSFSQKHLLTYHKRTHTGENPYPCTICGKMFRGTATLKYHERTHTGHKPHKCIFCVKAFTQLGSLRLHSRKEHQSEKIYECEVCMEQFEKFKELSSHKKTHLGTSSEEKSPYQDDSCQRQGELKVPQCETRSNLPIGSCSIDDESKGIFVSEDNSSFSSLISTGRKKRNSSESSDNSQRTAYKTHSKASIVGCIIERHADEQVLARAVKEEYGNICLTSKKESEEEVCNQEFLQADMLKVHTRTHTGESPHSCKICEKTFRTPGALTVHQRTHNGQKPYKCIFCSACFTQRGPLLQHCRRIHSSDQIYECSICKERFEKYRDLSAHKHVHSDVSCTMVKQLYVQHKEEDELEPLQSTHLDVVLPISPLNVKMGDCDSNEENDSVCLVERSCDVLNDPNNAHENYTANRQNKTCEQVGNVRNISFLNECLPVVIKQEREDAESPSDSGVYPDTSPLDAHDKCNEHESDSIYEVYMEPIKSDRKEKDYLSITGNCSSQAAGNISMSLQEHQNVAADGVYECSESTSDDDELSSCSRVTTPDNDYLFSWCSGDQRNSFFERKSETSISSQFLQPLHRGSLDSQN